VVGDSAGDADVAATVAIVAAATTAAPCCGPVATVMPSGSSPDAAVLAAARGTLDERNLIGTAVSDLSTLAGAREGTVGVTLRTRNTRVSIGPSKSRTHGGNAAHLRLEKPRFLFLEGLGGAPVAPAGTAVVLTGASTDDFAVGASMPAAGASSSARGDGGGGFHLSRGRPRHSLLPPPPPMRSSPASPGGEPLLLAQPVLLVLLLPALLPPDSPLLHTCRPLLLPLLRGAGGRPSPGRWWI
jgi:hypothetical protein